MNNDLLLEIGCEELPKDNMTAIADNLAKSVRQQLLSVHLNHDDIKTFIAPRRMAILVPNLEYEQPAQLIERQGPNVDKAFDKEGTPTMACMGFARACGVSVDQLQTQKTDKGDRVYCKINKPGSKTVEIIADLIIQAIKKMALSKPMRWGSNTIEFIRPVHWVVFLYGNQVVPATILGKKTDKQSRGHRFHHPQAITIRNADEYEKELMAVGKVIPDFAKRQQSIHDQIVQQCKDHQKPIIDQGLLEEVTALVEWPVVLKGSFKAEFLALPKEVLITSMATHQKCFPIEDERGNLINDFILVSNIESKDPQTVIEGNQRVINARLADAAFFYEKDRKTPLLDQLGRLNDVVFQKKLGSLGDKVNRVKALAAEIAKQIGADQKETALAASLAKCDLVTDMVYEFPSLQGIMGSYYAQKDQVKPETANAIRQHYYPRYSGDHLPENPIACAVALADRLDTLVGILGINLIPTGDKDPFALRRAAIGILRILIEKQLPLDLLALLESAKAKLTITLENKQVVEQAFQFLLSRLKAWYAEGGISAEVFEAVLANNPTKPLDFHHRVLAVQQFKTLPEAEALAAANKRVSNILKKATNGLPTKADAKLFKQDEERTLAKQLATHSKTVESYYQNADYTKALTDLSALKEPIDHFFDQVMVMTDDQQTRVNRLALLKSLRELFTQVADISLL